MKRSLISLCVLSVSLLCIAASFVSWELWRWASPLIYDSSGYRHHGGVMGLISTLVSTFFDLLPYGGVLGTLIAVAVMPGCCALLPEPYKSWRYTLTLAGTGLLLTLISTGASVEFFFINPGTAIRPMTWAAAQFLLLFAGIAAAVWFGPWHVKSDAPRWMRWSGILLCLTPFPAGAFFFQCAVQVNGLIISD